MNYELEFDPRALKEWKKVVVFVVAVGKREKEETYDKAKERLFF